MITVHHLEQSRSVRIIWLLEELGVDYSLKSYARDPKTNLAPPEYLALHPLGKAPLITDGDKVLAETGAIAEYIIDKYDAENWRPAKGSPERIAYNYWLHAAEGTLMPYLILHLFMTRMETAPPFFMRPIIKAVTGQVRKAYLTPSLTKFYTYMDAELEGVTWFAGDTPTLADIMMSFPLQAAAGRGALDDTYPHIMTYIERLNARPAYNVALAKSGNMDIVK